MFDRINTLIKNLIRVFLIYGCAVDLREQIYSRYEYLIDFDILSDEEKQELGTTGCLILAEKIAENRNALGLKDDYIPEGVGYNPKRKTQLSRSQSPEVFVSYQRNKNITTPITEKPEPALIEKKTPFCQLKEKIVSRLLNPDEALLADRDRRKQINISIS